MKVTVHNKDDIARLIAEKAFKHPDDVTSNNMMRVSEALISVGTMCSPFRTLANFRTEMIPCGEDENSSVTYLQALNNAMKIAEII